MGLWACVGAGAYWFSCWGGEACCVISFGLVDLLTCCGTFRGHVWAVFRAAYSGKFSDIFLGGFLREVHPLTFIHF